MKDTMTLKSIPAAWKLHDALVLLNSLKSNVLNSDLDRLKDAITDRDRGIFLDCMSSLVFDPLIPWSPNQFNTLMQIRDEWIASE